MPQQSDIENRLRQAADIVETLALSADLRPVAFDHALTALATVSSDARAPGLEQTREGSTREGSKSGPSLAAISERLQLDIELIRETFYLDGDDVRLGVPASKFDSRKAAATQQIALMLAAGRQAAGMGEWTPSEAIREACREYGRFDGANFAKAIKRMGDVFTIRGRGPNVDVRVTRPGFERASALIRQIRSS